MTEEINFYSTRKDYGWLSNFAKYPIAVDGILYKSVEHYYQSKKAKYPDDEKAIRRSSTSSEAKRKGRFLHGKDRMVENWDKIKDDVMFRALWAKFNQNPDLAHKLIETIPKALHEDSPTDMYWGKKGQDKLGKMLMQIRSELKVMGDKYKPFDENEKEKLYDAQISSYHYGAGWIKMVSDRTIMLTDEARKQLNEYLTELVEDKSKHRKK